jgi:hypothetical protein
VPFVLDKSFVQLVVEFEVACGQYLEDWVSIVFEEENIIISLVLYFDICKALSSEEPYVDAVGLKTLD